MSRADAARHVDKLMHTPFLSDKQSAVLKDAEYACSVIGDADFIQLTPTEHRLLTAGKGLLYGQHGD